jgi:hypothetical protein
MLNVWTLVAICTCGVGDGVGGVGVGIWVVGGRVGGRVGRGLGPGLGALDGGGLSGTSAGNVMMGTGVVGVSRPPGV